jgi:predicted amidohydrolase YtcJ
VRLADTIFVNAAVLTVDAEFTRAEAVAVAEGRILAIGTEADVLPLADDSTDVVDCGGNTLLPGFVEAHGHPTAEMNMLGPGSVDLRATACGSAEEVLRRLRAAIAAAGPDGWVTAFGWDPLLLPDLPPISGDFLTGLAPEVPVSVMHYSAHSTWANRAALERLGITSGTADPAGSAYVRHADGTPTGEGRELPASMVLMGPSMEVDESRFEELLDHQLRRMAAAGVTATGDLAFHPDSHRPAERYFAGTAAPVRVRVYEMTRPEGPSRTAGQADGRPEPERALFRQVGAKVWSDGSPWIGNIETSFGYEDSPSTHSIGLHPGHRGCSNYTSEDLLAIGRTYLAAGWQIACHVHGDLAVDTVLDVVEALAGQYPDAAARFRLEHCGSITPEQLARAHALGATASFFVAHIHFYGDVLTELFGERAEAWTPAGAAAACGMPFSLHNDAPVTPEDPLLSIQTAVTRRTSAGRVMGAEYAVGVEDALRAHTLHAAWQLRSEHEFGSIEVGKYADFVLLDADPTRVPADAIGSIQVLGTWLGGRPAYAVDGAAASVG